MGALTDNLEMLESRKNAGQLLNTLATLRTQWTDINTSIDALKVKIKTDVQGDTWNGVDIEQLGRELQIRAGILAKRPKYKAALVTLKALVNDTTYETEIQAEIDLL